MGQNYWKFKSIVSMSTSINHTFLVLKFAQTQGMQN